MNEHKGICLPLLETLQLRHTKLQLGLTLIFFQLSILKSKSRIFFGTWAQALVLKVVFDFDFKTYITILTFMSVPPYGVRRCLVLSSTIPSHFTITAVGSQNITNKSCLVCVNSENYPFWVTLNFIGGKNKRRTLHY